MIFRTAPVVVLPSQKRGKPPLLKKFFKPPFLFFFLVLALLLVFLIVKNVHFTDGRLTFGPIVAKVNGQAILKNDYEDRLAAQKHYLTNIAKDATDSAQKVAELPQTVLEEMIQEALLTDFLKKNGITVSDDEVRQRMKEITVDPNWKGDWKAYENSLKNQYQTTLVDAMRSFRLIILKEKIASLKTKKHLFGIWVAKEKVPFTPQEEEEAARINQGKLAKAKNTLQRVQKGEDFSSLAKELSEHPQSAQKGGDFGWLVVPPEAASVSDFPAVRPVFEAVSVLKRDEVKIFEGFTGYLVAKVTEVNEGPAGQKSIDQWYQELRKNADVSVLINLKP